MGAWGASGKSELADNLFSAFPLELPEVELPTEGELLSGADIAAALVVGGRARANLVPQRGSRLSGVATVLTSEDGGEQDAEVSPLSGLFVSPLVGGGGVMPGTSVPPAEPLLQETNTSEKDEETHSVRWTLALAMTAGLAWSIGRLSGAGVGRRREFGRESGECFGE